MRRLLALLLLLGVLAAPARADGSGPLRGFVVCLDPGHTSETSQGTASRDGKLTERHVNWVVGQRLKALLEAAGGDRRADQDERRRRSSRTGGGRRSPMPPTPTCCCACTAIRASSPASRPITRTGREGASASPALPPPSSPPAAAPRSSSSPPSSLRWRGALRDAGIKGDSQTAIGGKQGALTGSIFSRVPALTVEMCVLTNAHDYRFIRTPAGQDAMAEALLAGVEAYARRESRHHDRHTADRCRLGPERPVRRRPTTRRLTRH